MKKYRPFILTTIIALFLGFITDFQVIKSNQNKYIKEIQQAAKTLAAVVNEDGVAMLEGNSNDLISTDYIQLKKQLTRVLNENILYRYIYIMRKINGNVIFLVDNQSVKNSQNGGDTSLANPGEIYTDTTTGLMNVFRTGTPTVTGPELDKWGNFYSGLAPILDPKTGKTIAVIGVDVLQSDWNSKDLPTHIYIFTITLLIVFLLFLIFRYFSHINAHKDALFHSEQRFKDIAELSGDWIWEVDLMGNYTYCSNKISNILGLKAEDVIGTSAFSYIHNDDIQRCKNYFNDITYKKENLVGLIHKCINRDQSICVIESNGAPIFDELGNMVGYRGFDKNISEKALYEAKLLEAKQAAENSNKAKSDFLANMSHEIRTPINGILGMTELSLLTHLSDVQREYLESIQFSAYSLLDVINDILDFSKIEAGKLDIEEIVFDLREMVENTIPIISSKCLEKEIELLCNIDPHLPKSIISDPLRIKQILINLLSNAIKFTEKGEILVSVWVKDISNESFVFLSVSDTGIGILEEKQAKIFDSFIQSDTSTTRKYGGTGLGLTISKNLASLMGGEIQLESEPNKGSKFTLCLPLKTSIDTDDFSPNIPLKHVLVVDDNSTNLKIIHEMLNWFGVKNTTVNSPKKALEFIQNNIDEIDTLIIDHQMPEMDGLELADYIRTNIHFDRAPYIMMFSSSNRESALSKNNHSSIQYFITKPVKMKDLHAILQKISGKDIALKAETISENLPEFVIEGDQTILVAEDNPINMKIIREILKMGGYNVISAVNGEEAIAKFELTKPDLIFMDIHMPLIDGLQATLKIREMIDFKQVPIIAITADAMKGDKERCLEVGMNDYIAKPFKQKEIFAMLKKYLKK